MLGSKKDKEITVKSPSAFTSAIRNKWLLWGIAGMIVIVYFAGQASKKEVKKQTHTVEAEFSDTTPGVKSSERLSLARLQRSLEKTQQKLADKTESDENTIKDLRKALDRERKERAEEADELKAASKELREKLAKAPDSVRANNNDSGAPSRDRSSASTDPSSYIRPPNVGADGAIAPPTRRREDDGGKPQRRSLPTRNSSTVSSRPGEATILRGSDTSKDGGDATVLSGPETVNERDDRYADLNGMLPMGSFMETVILTGADFGASTKSQSNPQPTLLRVQDNSFLPNHAKYDLRDCFVMGAGYGDLSSERAYITGARLSCVHRETGQILESEVQSYLVDSDGRLGMRGKVDRRSGAIMGKAMVAGFAEGAAKILAAGAQDTTSTITGSGVVNTSSTDDIAKAGGFAGAGRAAEILAEQYLDEAESMYPVIAVNAGRKAHLVIQIGQKLKWQPVNGQEEE